jgi:hypothetical protein
VAWVDLSNEVSDVHKEQRQPKIYASLHAQSKIARLASAARLTGKKCYTSSPVFAVHLAFNPWLSVSRLQSSVTKAALACHQRGRGLSAPEVLRARLTIHSSYRALCSLGFLAAWRANCCQLRIRKPAVPHHCRPSPADLLLADRLLQHFLRRNDRKLTGSCEKRPLMSISLTQTDLVMLVVLMILP